MKISRFCLFAFLIMALLTMSLTARAAGDDQAPGASPWAASEFTKVRLIAAQVDSGNSDQILLGLHFKLQDGWKVYWRSAGDAGYPPRLSWKNSENLADVEMRWPVPEHFVILGFDSLGYKKEVVYPLIAHLEKAGQATHLSVDVDYLTCAEICVPIKETLQLDLPQGPGAASEFAHLINRYNVQVPGDGTLMGLTLGPVSFYEDATGDKTKGQVRFEVTSNRVISQGDVFVESARELVLKMPKITLDGSATRATVDVAVEGLDYIDGPFVGRDMTVTFVDRSPDGMRSAEWTAAIVAGTGALPTSLGATPAAMATAVIESSTSLGGSAAPVSLLTVLAFAFIGGVILNLMPCVLPVLSIKLLNVLDYAGAERGEVRRGFLATSAGIVAAFLALAAALAALKLAGASIGWGIQFQNPWFLVFMTLIVTFFAANLWGLFEISLPQWIGGAAVASGQKTGLSAHFLSGVFATLLATPCSAPFLGSAVGFALSRGSAEILGVFLILGLGLASPYLLVAAFPGFARHLPKPGMWMVWLRRVMGLALAATAVWLLSVLSVQLGERGALALAALMAGIVGVLVMKHFFKASSKVTAISLLALTVGAFVVPSKTTHQTVAKQMEAAKAVSKSDVESFWQPFDQGKIDALVGQGKLVFVDVTADWCITCQVNKKFVLGQDDIAARLKAPNLVAMKADWTNPDQVIADYLAAYGRYGIPFNIIYGPKAPKGVILPELLTREAVLEALEKAGG